MNRKIVDVFWFSLFSVLEFHGPRDMLLLFFILFYIILNEIFGFGSLSTVNWHSIWHPKREFDKNEAAVLQSNQMIINRLLLAQI